MKQQYLDIWKRPHELDPAMASWKCFERVSGRCEWEGSFLLLDAFNMTFQFSTVLQALCAILCKVAARILIAFFVVVASSVEGMLKYLRILRKILKVMVGHLIAL